MVLTGKMDREYGLQEKWKSVLFRGTILGRGVVTRYKIERKL
jgi:hypothetical protein